MHLLFLSSLLPEDEPSTGFEIANRALIEAYRRRGVRLTVAGFRRPGARAAGEGEIDLGERAIENAGATLALKLGWVALAFARGRPIASAKLAGLGAPSLLARLAEAGPADGIILNGLQIAAAYPFLASRHPSIFVAHNVEHASARQNAANAAKPHARLLYAREARLMERAERRLARQAAVVHAFTEADLAGLGLAGAAKGIALPLTVGRTAKPDDGVRTHDVGLIGTWSWAPNCVGLDWFLKAVVPHLPPDVTVAIAGRIDGAPPPVPPNVRFLGRVEHAQRFVASSRVLALSTKGGTGVQLKTLETCEEGMPAVATPEAVRGVCELPGNVAVEADPGAFADWLAGMVAAERAGKRLRLDGSAFARHRRVRLDAGIGRGLDLLRAELTRRSDVPAGGDVTAVPPALQASGARR